MSDAPNNPYNRGIPYNQGNRYGQGGPYAQGAPTGGVVGAPAKFCAVCGSGLVASAVICPSCGSPTGAGFGPTAKTKTAAVLLAVFLGPWTWLYTYRRNAWKFWVGLVGGAAGFVIAIIVAGTYVGSTGFATCSSNGYPCNYYSHASSTAPLAIFAIVVCYLIPVAVWIWAIIDVAVAPDSFYQRYPTG